MKSSRRHYRRENSAVLHVTMTCNVNKTLCCKNQEKNVVVNPIHSRPYARPPHLPQNEGCFHERTQPTPELGSLGNMLAVVIRFTGTCKLKVRTGTSTKVIMLFLEGCDEETCGSTKNTCCDEKRSSTPLYQTEFRNAPASWTSFQHPEAQLTSVIVSMLVET